MTGVVRTTSTTAWHALMLLMSCALPCEVSVPSLSSTIWGCIIPPGPMPGIPIGMPRPPIMFGAEVNACCATCVRSLSLCDANT